MHLRSDPPEMSGFLNRLLSIKIDQQNVLFREFSDRLKNRIRIHDENGTLEKGIETVLCESCHKIKETVVRTDPVTGAETKHVHLRLKHISKPWSFAQIMEGREATHWRKVEFFARNIKSGRVWAFTDAGNRTMQNGSIEPHCYEVGPLTSRAVPVYTIDGYRSHEHWEPLEESEARKEWDAYVSTLPSHTEEDLHLITGAILPIWDRLKGDARVKRVRTDAGERLLGRVLPENEVFDTMSRLGVNSGASDCPIAEVVQRLLQGTHKYKLANRWMIKRCRVNGEIRIEIVGPDYKHFGILKQEGVYYERGSDYVTRYYVPVKIGEPWVTEEVLEAVVKDRPIVKSVKVEAL